MSDQTPNQPQAPAADTTPRSPSTETNSPFEPATLPGYDLSQLRDELEEAQEGPEAARELAARHWSRLLYDPNYPWRGQQPYPQAPKPSGK